MNLIFMGAPGAGKGTQAEVLSKRRGIVQISTGEILREAVKNQTEQGLKAKSCMDKGDLVPDEIVVDIIKEKIKGKDCEAGFILDGFPRTKEQAESLDVILDSISRSVDHALFFDVDDKELVYRLLKRAEEEGRSDDNLKSIQNRLKVFREKTEPVLDHYENKSVLFRISGAGEVKEISQEVEKALNK